MIKEHVPMPTNKMHLLKIIEDGKI